MNKKRKNYLLDGVTFNCHAGVRYIDILPDGSIWCCSDKKLPFKLNILDENAIEKLREHKNEIIKHIRIVLVACTIVTMSILTCFIQTL